MISVNHCSGADDDQPLNSDSLQPFIQTEDIYHFSHSETRTICVVVLVMFFFRGLCL